MAISDSGTYRQTLEWEGAERDYLVHVPGRSSARARLPLLVVLHGGGGSAEFARRIYGWTRLADREGVLVVFPEAAAEDPTRPVALRENPRVWNDGGGRSAVARRNVDDIGYLRAVLAAVQTRHAVDPGRVFMTGFSNGASMTLRAGVELSEQLTAIAPFSGHLCVDDPRPARPVPMLYLTGLVDPLNPFAGGPITTPWGSRRQKPPVMDSIRTWIRLIEAADEPASVSQQNGIRHVRYGPGRTGCEVELVTIEGQGHEWPGAPRTLPRSISGPQTDKLNATEVIWGFFARFDKRARVAYVQRLNGH